MCKKGGTDLSKEYAQRWRDLAAQVVPPMMEKETIIVMVDTLSVFYYEKMVVMQAPLKLVGLGSSSSMDSFASWKMNGSGMKKGRERGDATSRRR